MKNPVVYLLLLILAGCASSLNINAANYNVQLGLIYLQQEDQTRAKEKLLLALQEAPHWPVALDAMAYFAESTHDYKTAEKYYKKAIFYGPHKGGPLNNYGTFLCRTKHYKQSIPYFLAATKIASYVKVGEAYENAGLCALEFGARARAKDYFEQALWHDSSRAQAAYHLSLLNFEQKNVPAAKFYLKKYFQLQGHDAQSDLLERKLQE